MSILKEIKLRERLAHAYNSLATAYEKAQEDGISLDVVRAIETETEDRVFTDRAAQYAAKKADEGKEPTVETVISSLLEGLDIKADQPTSADTEQAAIDAVMADLGKTLEGIFGEGQVKVQRLTQNGVRPLFGEPTMGASK